MTTATSPAAQLFGTNLVALVTPMNPDGSLSAAGTGALVEHLLAAGCDGLVVAGTTGEAPTLTDVETAGLVRAVADRAGTRARVIAGVGTNDTASSVRRARAAAAAGADALLVVCPYYSRPTQAGLLAHFRAVADATDLPVMLYDVPARTGTALAAATLLELAGHPRIRAVKDAKGDLAEATAVLAASPLAYYCGNDELALPYLACGATGLVSVVGHLAADRCAGLIRAVRDGDLATAREIHRALLPLLVTPNPGDAVQYAPTTKAVLAALGIIPHPTVRLPLVQPAPSDVNRLVGALPGTANEAVTKPLTGAVTGAVTGALAGVG